MNKQITEEQKQEIRNTAESIYYVNKDVIKFLLADNLAIKMILLEKGIITEEEFYKHQKASQQILETKSAQKLNELMNQLLGK